MTISYTTNQRLINLLYHSLVEISIKGDVIKNV
nr:MAG TPA: hypothetical protein [Caudoviricetes sp.]